MDKISVVVPCWNEENSPALLPDMYHILKEDYDSVAIKRSTRTGESRIRSFLSKSFYKFVNRISKTVLKDSGEEGGKR